MATSITLRSVKGSPLTNAEVDANFSALKATADAAVVSVGLSLPSIFTVSNSPVTSSGTLTAALASQSAALVFASPVSGSGAPSFRGLVASDIPTLNQNTTGSSGSCTGNAATATTATNQSGGTVNATTGAFSNTVSINSGTSQPLSLTTSSAGPWAIALTRSDLGQTSQVYNPGNYWYFQHRPSFAGNTPLDAGNYTSYSPSLTGSGASGTWGISVTGSAASAPITSAQSNYIWSASSTPTAYSLGIQSSFVSSTQGFQSYGSVMTMNTVSGGGGALQLYVPYSPTYGGTGLQVRFGNYDVSSGNSWTSWKTLLASDNYNSYSPTLTGGGASGSWGISVTGSSGSCTGNAATATTATNWGSYGGVPAAGTSFANANTIGRSDASGYTYFSYINSNTGNNENPGVSQVIVTNGTDNFYRKSSISSFTSYVQSNASGSWSINAATATTLIGDQTNWASYRSSAVANMLGWKNYGNSHVIFDASNGTAPNGTVVNNTTPGVAWAASYPTLMGWNGSSTFGVRTYVSNYADTCTGNSATATTATNQSGGTVSATTGSFSSTVSFAAGSGVASNGDITARRSNSAQGVLYFGNGTPYLYYDGSNFQFNGGNVYVGGVQAVTNSGSWGINVTGSSASCTGNAATATYASTVNINYSNASNSTYQMLWGSGTSVYGASGIYCNPSQNRLFADTYYSSTNTNFYLAPAASSNLSFINSTGISISNSAVFPFYIGSTTTTTLGVASYGATSNATWASRASTLSTPQSISAVGAILGYGIYSLSDIRMKEDIEDISVEDAVHFVRDAQPKKFYWKDSGNRDAGFIAQQLMSKGYDFLISSITNDKLEELTDEYGITSPAGEQLTVKYDSIVPIHGAVLNHLLDKIEQLEAKLEALQA